MQTENFQISDKAKRPWCFAHIFGKTSQNPSKTIWSATSSLQFPQFCSWTKKIRAWHFLDPVCNMEARNKSEIRSNIKMTPCLMSCPRRRARSYHHTCQLPSSTSPSLQVSAAELLQSQCPESRVFYKINNAVASLRFFQLSKIFHRWSLPDPKMELHQCYMIRRSMRNNSYAANRTSTSITVGNARILSLLQLTYSLSTEEWWILKAPRATSFRKSPYLVPMSNQDLHSALFTTRSTQHPRSQGGPLTMVLAHVAMPTRCLIPFSQAIMNRKNITWLTKKTITGSPTKTRTSAPALSRTSHL